MKYIYKFIIVLLLQICLLSPLTAQDMQKSLFGEVDKKMEEAKATGLDYLSPTNYSKAYEDYTEAAKEFKDGANLKDIQEKLGNVGKYLDAALAKSEVSRITLKSSIKARNDAMKVDAAKHASELWIQAEEKFRDAGEEVEDGDIPDAEEASKEAEDLFRSAELS